MHIHNDISSGWGPPINTKLINYIYGVCLEPGDEHRRYCEELELDTVCIIEKSENTISKITLTIGRKLQSQGLHGLKILRLGMLDLCSFLALFPSISSSRGFCRPLELYNR